jgi:hypothetical protein
MTPPDECSDPRRDLYLTTNNAYKSQIPMAPVGFEPAIPASQRPQTQPFENVASGMGNSPSITTLLVSYLTTITTANKIQTWLKLN